MNITLRPNERLYINGAVIRADRRVTIELLNDVTFLLENHVMQAGEATTLLRQIYFVIQVILMEGRPNADTKRLAREMIKNSEVTFADEDILKGLRNVLRLVDEDAYFEALKKVRALYPAEERELSRRARQTSSAA